MNVILKLNTMKLQYDLLPLMGIKYLVNEKFFDKWTPIMAYVLGFIYADGSLEDASYLRGKYIRICSVEKGIILRIKKWLDSEHTITKSFSAWPNGKPVYMLRIGSHKLYYSLTKIGLYPNKSLTITFPQNVPEKYFNDFIRGYFDGDGCVYLEMAKGERQRYIVKKLSIIFTSGSKKFLEGMNDVIKGAIDIRQDKVYKSHRSYQLRYSTADTIKLFKFLYKKVGPELYFKRKIKVFLKYFLLRKIKVDFEVQKILKDLKLWPGGEVANTAVCKTATRGCKSHPGLQDE